MEELGRPALLCGILNAGVELPSPLQTIVELSSYGIVIYDKQGVISFANPAVTSVVGHEPKDVIGTTGAVFLHPEDRQIAHECFFKVLEAPGRAAEFKQRVVTKSGDVRWICARIVNCLDDPSVEGIISYFRDISDQVVTEEALAQAQRRETLGLLTSSIAHDFNNLLTIILGYGSILSQGQEGPGELGEMMDAAERASELTERLLMFSGNHARAFEAIDIHDVINEQHRMLRRLVPRTIAFEVRSDPESGSVYADRLSIHQVLMNLVINARDAVAQQEDGEITIQTASVELSEKDTQTTSVLPGSFCEITVTDNGHGIPPEVLPRIFDPFFTTKEPGSGTGLGLAITKSIVDEMQGVLQIETAVDEGTTFRVRLPRLMAESVEDAKAEEIIPGGSERVLIAENDPAVSRFVARCLTGLGYSPIIANDYDCAVTLLAEEGEAFDLVLISGVMQSVATPLLSHVHNTHPKLCTLMMTGVPQSARAEYDVPIVGKPFSIRQLAVAVRDAIDSAKS